MVIKPKLSPVPNILFEEYVKILRPSELRVLLIVIFHAFGIDNRLEIRISISQFSEFTGMGQPSVVRALKSLASRKILSKRKYGKKGNEKSFYTLNFKPEAGV